jgi:hypothetical protein
LREEGGPVSLRGTAVLAIWNDVAPGGDAEFDHWAVLPVEVTRGAVIESLIVERE